MVSVVTLAWVTSTVVPGVITERILVTNSGGNCICSTPWVLMMSAPNFRLCAPRITESVSMYEVVKLV